MMCDIRLDLRLTELLCIYKTKHQEIEGKGGEEEGEKEGGERSPSDIPTKIGVRRESVRRLESKQRIEVYYPIL